MKSLTHPRLTQQKKRYDDQSSVRALEAAQYDLHRATRMENHAEIRRLTPIVASLQAEAQMDGLL